MGVLVVNQENAHKTARMAWWRRQRGRGLKPLATRCGPLPRQCYRDADVEGAPETPLEQWPDLIADLERRRGTLLHVFRDSPLKVKDQKQLGYCHAASPTGAFELLRESQGLPYVELSLGSVGGPVTGYRNEGAWIIDDLQQVVEQGIASTEFVPMLQVSRSGWKPGAVENAQLHRAEEFWRLSRRNVLQTGSALLAGFPVCVGLNWWGHAVTLVRVIDAYRQLAATNWRRYRFGFLNSWGLSYGDQGYAELEGDHMIADEQYVLRLAKQSFNRDANHNFSLAA